MSTSVINVGGQQVGVQVIPSDHIAVPRSSIGLSSYGVPSGSATSSVSIACQSASVGRVERKVNEVTFNHTHHFYKLMSCQVARERIRWVLIGIPFPLGWWISIQSQDI